VDNDGSGRGGAAPISPADEEEFRRMANDPNIYETIAKSIAPSIYGSLDIKKAIACLLFGGSRKRFVGIYMYGTGTHYCTLKSCF
jgi:DNA replication licensing factor MCM5